MLRKVDAMFMHRYLITDRGFTGLKSLNYLNSYVSHRLSFNQNCCKCKKLHIIINKTVYLKENKVIVISYFNYRR